MLAEALGILAHREVSETGHDRQVGARDGRRDRLRILRPRRIIVLAAEQVERAAGRVDLAEPAADVAVDRSEEHTSELQSLMRISYAVFCLKTKNKQATRSHKH